MSLHLSNRMTSKQRAILEANGYLGTWDLTIEQAAEIITAIFEEQRMHKDEIQDAWEGYGYGN